MRRHLSLLFFCISASLLHAQGVRFLLIGDSTVAPHSGWGNAFCGDLTPGATCVNMAKGGRSSKSYREDGSWAQVLDQLKSNAKFKQTYVLLQFGHNDQPGKPGRSTDVTTEFPANMKGFVEEIKATGAQAVLVTPLSRRAFGKDGKIQDGLGPWADADKTVAASENVPVLDLHADSIAALNAMGKDEADTLAMAPRPDPNAPVVTTAAEKNGAAEARFDGTHLGAKGAALFSHMVEKELIAAVPALKSSFVSPAQ